MENNYNYAGVRSGQTQIDRPLFSRWQRIFLATMLLIGVCLIILDGFRSARTDLTLDQGGITRSTSAFGWHALRRLAEEAAIDVQTSSYKTHLLSEIDDLTLAFIPTPNGPEDLERYLETLQKIKGNLVIVAPKWDFDQLNKAELDHVTSVNQIQQYLFPPRSITSFGQLILAETDTRRAPAQRFNKGRATRGGRPSRLRTTRQANTQIYNIFDIPAEYSELQLLRTGAGSALIQQPEGKLLLQLNKSESYEATNVFLLSDPDIFSNFQILKQDNSAVALAIINRLLPAQGKLIIDESYGSYEPPSLYLAAFSLPWMPITLLTLLFVSVSLWSFLPRFGKAQDQTETQQIGTGMEVLRNSTAQLIVSAGKAPPLLSDWLLMHRLEIDRLWHCPPHLTGADYDAWLSQLEKKRGIKYGYKHWERRCKILLQRRSPSHKDISAFISDVWAWKQQMSLKS